MRDVGFGRVDQEMVLMENENGDGGWVVLICVSEASGPICT